ncbi:GGDEF domain-containing protein [Syntrophomonas palmitatica]|uniref:GGDEF domain-containing protein n=1 Tax=Syntrophomonas palmitatica TaxID=402877 RepID=UPI0006CFB73A|nr:GGDEF domain-containing protein [Syntrophomonas palmitatica]
MNWLARFIGSELEFPLRHRVFNLLALVGIFIGVSTSISNLLLGLYSEMFITFTFTVFLVCMYYLSMTIKIFPAFVTLLFMAFVFYPAMWFILGGTSGTVGMQMVVLSAMIALLLPPRRRFYFLIVFFIMASALVYIEFRYPDTVLEYHRQSTQYINMWSGLIISCLANLLLVLLVINEYNQESARVKLYLSQVEAQKHEINQQARLLRVKNQELSEAYDKAEQLNHMLLDEKAMLELVSITDGLTRIFNRRHILHCLEMEIARSREQDGPLSILLLDLDHFKSVNDTYGHLAGDEVLQQVAQTIKNTVRNTDMVGRYGGEEFLVLLPESNLQGAIAIAERLRLNIAALTWNYEGLHVTISGGVSEFKHESMWIFLNRVDNLLYKAKANGRNRIENDSALS